MSTVLAIGDTHCPAMKVGYLDFLKATADSWQPDHVVHIGDLVDNCAYSFHEKKPRLKDPYAEHAAAIHQVQAIAKEFPNTHLMLGNHDALVERKAVTAGLDPHVLRPFKDIWELPDSWVVHERFETLTLDGVDYYHGDKFHGGMYAMLNNAKSTFRSCVMGHHHSNFGALWHSNDNSLVYGFATGCGVDQNKMAMEYGRKFVRKPILGCAVIKDTHYAIPIPWVMK